MSYPEEQYSGPERRASGNDESVEWMWPPRYSQPDEMTPDIESLIFDLEKDIEQEAFAEDDETREVGMLAELQARLAAMGVEDPETLDINMFREVGSMNFAPYSLEDVHYQLYCWRQKKEQTSYVSVKVDKLLSIMPIDEQLTEIIKLQERQTQRADMNLSSLGINPYELKDIVDNGTPGEKFRLRCLDRLMQEKYLKEMALGLRKKYIKSGEQDTVEYPSVIYAALQTITQACQDHKDRQPKTTDGKLWHQLEDRALTRAMSFANPLIGNSRPE